MEHEKYINPNKLQPEELGKSLLVQMRRLIFSIELLVRIVNACISKTDKKFPMNQITHFKACIHKSCQEIVCGSFYN